ncbi:Orotidine 5'-phosphate decarboxylase [Maioricimonas rarisocia]|uniref:Orotidine 5'-phosphate decarboxylase n=1 Tax=Maioricimonas rarisocia TaxID=2528026 RepID=A0A517Z568_9PLAN|nr:orotidine-5'-phosphate decarboxylase [Maioricimonas rarisocia]QDU37628.1 Orotidine 5'-phosphate decarboxylase [Maioricimonas rarisocia]
MKTYAERLQAAVQAKGTPALVGLDPRWEQLPTEIVERARSAATTESEVVARAYEEFCRRIIDIVAGRVPAVKPQAAFFEACGPEGAFALARVIRHARDAGLIVICDAKRGDIGSTAEAYASAYLAGDDPDAAPWAADALTINPYLGVDTLEPFVRTATARGAGLYVLVRTSNPGAGRFQDLTADGQTVYHHVATAMEELAAESAGEGQYGAVGAVVGATYPSELEELRQVMPHVPLLIPGYGSQGGTSADTAAAFDEDGHGALINSSRGIIFAYRREPYAEAFGESQWEAAVDAATRDMIADLAANTPAAALVANK